VALPRPLLIVPVLLALAPPASAAPDTGSGGTLAQPLRQGPGGGALAPERLGAAAASESSLDGGAVAAEAARDETSAAPRWGKEPREPEWAPSPAVDEPPADEAAAEPAEARTVSGVETARVEGGTGGGERADDGSLPWTGLEIAALAAIGLGVLTLGAALVLLRRSGPA
jgi:hypothetical protein